MSLDYIKELVDFKPGASNSQIFINCPFPEGHRDNIPDSSYLMGVDLERNIYHCLYCDASGKATSLFTDAEVKKRDASLDEIEEKIKAISFDNNARIQTVDLDLISNPISSESTPMSYKYLIDRGFTDKEIEEWGIRSGKSYVDTLGIERKMWSGRIIFPYFLKDKPIYCVGRAYVNKEPKYYNTPMSKVMVLYGYDTLPTHCSRIILCEGIVSAIACKRYTGEHAVAMLGKRLSSWQLERLKEKTSTIYKALEKSGTKPKEHVDLINQLLSFGFRVFDINMPEDGKDPDDLKEEFIEYINSAKEVPLI